MPFTMPTYPILTADQVNPFHMALTTALQDYSQGMNAAYLPKTLQADVMSKQLAPIATIASNPLMYASIPDAQRQMLGQYVGNMIQGSMGGSGGQGNAPASEGIFGNILGNIFGSSSNSQGAAPTAGGGSSGTQAGDSTMPTSTAQPNQGADASSQGGAPATTDTNTGSPLLPAAGQGPAAGASARILAPYSTSPYKHGDLLIDSKTGKFVSAPTDTTISGQQQVLSGIASTLPRLKELSTQAQPFLEFGGMKKLREAQLVGNLANYGIKLPKGMQPNIPPGLVGKYNDFISNINTTADKLMTANNLPKDEQSLAMVKQIVTPVAGENDREYYQRVTNEMGRLKDQYAQSQQMISGGYNVSPGQNVPQGMVLGKAVSNQMGAPQQSVQQASPQPMATPNTAQGENQGYISIPKGAKTIPMRTPDGQIWDVDVNKVPEAVKRGAWQIMGNPLPKRKGAA